MKAKQRSDYTFKYNRKMGRHGWLRLTPAYSVKLVTEIVGGVPDDALILDPFSGTATTGLVAAQRRLSAHCLDINPFLVWVGNAKCRNYSNSELTKLRFGIERSLAECRKTVNADAWTPNIYNIKRWWGKHTLKILGSLRHAIAAEFGEPGHDDPSSLAWIAFCRLIIETSSAAFNHVSMSFHEEVRSFEAEQIESLYLEIADAIVESAGEKLSGSAAVYTVDSRKPALISDVGYSHVITSPPYPNRISYIRELRPYMYWTGFLDSACEAGELDWQAIGGTWGAATSRLYDWRPSRLKLPRLLEQVVEQIRGTGEKNALLMANYVWKYFHDMHLHLYNLRDVLRKGAVLCYIVGNSSFYGIQVPTERLLEDSMISLGYVNTGSRVVRKRNSKKELFEYGVYAVWKETKEYNPFSCSDMSAQQRQLLLF
jgi:hypothetical protein